MSDIKKIILSPRLQAAADFVRPRAAVADVGTDHGYIPVYLAQNGLAGRIIATDIKDGPLTSARSSAEVYGVAGRVDFIRTDGLDGLEQAGIDTVILAGMGGETMRGILERAGWTRTQGLQCILQPQTKCDELSAWLAVNGYGLSDARLVRDDGRIYIVLLTRAGKASETPLRLLVRKRDPLLPDYLDELIAKKRRVITGLQKSVRQADELARQEEQYEALQCLKEETNAWQR